MKAFRFPLQKVLEWRTAQLDIEEARFRRRAAELAEAERAQAELAAFAAEVERETRRPQSIDGADLAALAEFRDGARVRAASLAAERARRAEAMETQSKIMLEARRRCRLLERLQERRVAEWQAARDREIDEAAADSYLAQWGNRASRL